MNRIACPTPLRDDGGVRWIIGDIHGMAIPLEALLRAIEQRDPQARLYFVGDYVNRGPDSRNVLDMVIGLPNARFIRGNHDDIFDQVLNGHSYAVNAAQGNPLMAFSWFMQHGLADTLASYGAQRPRIQWLARYPTMSGLRELTANVPEAHRQFMRSLAPVIEEPDFFVAHGVWSVAHLDGAPTMAEQLASDSARRQALLWGRFELGELAQAKSWRRVGYFGHTTVDSYPELLGGGELRPIIGSKLVLIDTAAAVRQDGVLTAFCHESGEYVRAARDGRIL